MARKDVEDYYNKITDDYMNLLNELKDMEELESQKLVSPEMVEQLKKTVEPLKINYQRISWIIFLLNQPAKKEKVVRYKKSMKNKMLSIDPAKEHTPEAVRKEDLKILGTVNNIWTNNEG